MWSNLLKYPLEPFAEMKGQNIQTVVNVKSTDLQVVCRFF